MLMKIEFMYSFGMLLHTQYSCTALVNRIQSKICTRFLKGGLWLVFKIGRLLAVTFVHIKFVNDHDLVFYATVDTCSAKNLKMAGFYSCFSKSIVTSIISGVIKKNVRNNH